jgi:LuxR family transcriptional regulator, maltose regulon positive regulatory protein
MGAEAEFVAVRTKLLVPELRRGQVPRRELIGALEDGRTRRLTVVAAPTGFGKTSALAAWAAVSPARFGWVSLDEGDDDPPRFWTYVVAALEAAAPELPGTAARRLASPGVSIADEVLPVLVNELSRVKQPIVLVLDDYHVIEDPAIQSGVGYLIGRLPGEVHVVLAGQSDPPVGVGGLRARGELNELRIEDLRFSDDEAAALLNGTHALELTTDQLAGLQQRTEGWVAGLNLVALSLRDATDRDRFIERLPVEDRFLVDYLWNEVAAQQSPETREFLMRTAVVDRLSGALCDALVERTDSTATLAELEHRNTFVLALDADRRWYRYHPLFRATLLRQLERRAPASVADLHRRASAWFADQGDLHGAIEHAILAGDVHYAADALQRNWLALYSDGKANEVLAWVDRLPRQTLAEYPELVLGRGGMARAMGRLDDVEPWLKLVEQVADAQRTGGRRADLLAGVARQRAMLRLAEANVGEAVRLGRRAVRLRPEGSPEASSDGYFLAVCLFWTGSSRESETLLRDYLDATPPGDEDVRRMFAMALLAEACARRGDLDAADELVEQSLSTSEARGLNEHPPTEQTHVAGGIVHLERGDVERAEARFEHAVTLARRGGDRIEIAHALLWLGRGRARAGDAAGAGDALEAARTELAGARVPRLVPLIEALEAELPATPPPAAATNELSAAELRVLELLPSELGYREIAARLDLPLTAVRAHSHRIRRKLSASTRDEAVTAARRLELL